MGWMGCVKRWTLGHGSLAGRGLGARHPAPREGATSGESCLPIPPTWSRGPSDTPRPRVQGGGVGTEPGYGSRPDFWWEGSPWSGHSPVCDYAEGPGRRTRLRSTGRSQGFQEGRRSDIGTEGRRTRSRREVTDTSDSSGGPGSYPGLGTSS